MAETTDQRRPYAAPSNVVSVVQRARTRNLPDKIDEDFLRIVGIPDMVFGRVQEALRFLGLIGESNAPTDTFRSLSAAPDEEYKAILTGAIRNAYADDFARIDPGQDAQAQIVDAFRPYEPRSQTARMVMLFLGLCREADMSVLDAPRQRHMKGQAGSQSPRRPARKSTPPTRKNEVHRQDEGNNGVVANASGLLFGVTERDIAALPREEFEEVWSALGKVARARALSQVPPPSPQASPQVDEEVGEDEV